MEARFILDSETIKQIALELAEMIKPILASGTLAPLMTIDQLAKHLNVEKGWIYDRTRNKEDGIPHVKVGKYVRFNITEVMEWLKNQEI
jgi:excisionase family DNA binding protein